MRTHASWMAAAAFAAALSFAVAPSTASAADKKAERLWKSKCSSCHGIDGKGKTEMGAKMGIGDMTTAEFQKDLTDAKIKATIENGITREKNGKKQEMTSFKDDLSPEEITALVGWVKAFKK